MRKRLTISVFVCFAVAVSYGQKIGHYYISISSGGTKGHMLIFRSDSTLELSNIPHHMSPRIATVYKYAETDSIIEIFPEPISTQTSGLPIRTSTLEPKIHLTKIEGGFIDYSTSSIYVKQKSYSYTPDLLCVIDGKKYIQDSGMVDGYGLLKKLPKKNRALIKKLKGFNKDNCSVEFVRGLNAYKQFGIKWVYGVIVITSKK